MTDLGFGIFDADNHYYEALDAFTRHIDRRMARRAIQWGEIDGRTRLLVGGKVNRFIPNPTFDPIAKPGCMDAYFRGKNPEGLDVAAIFGDLEPINPAYRDRDARLDVMDAQGLERAFLFPTLGVGMEEALKDDPEACAAAFHAFNQWLDEDWGFHYRDRIYAAPMITLMDPARAVEELEWVLARDARLVVLRAAPVATPGGSRSLGDPLFDGFWARVNEAGIVAAFHGGDSGYGHFAEAWGEGGEMLAFKTSPLRSLLTADRPAFDAMAALVCHGVFHRFPNVRVACVEMGTDWLPLLLKKLKKTFGQMPGAFPEDPTETFVRHVWVSPFQEENIRSIGDLIGADRLIMGSDFPHAEGIPEPRDYVDELAGFDAGEIRQIMRENALELSQPSKGPTL